MRPLELRLAGFRSYRSERTVSFRDIDLVAIIGDTGAGKSSLLEAMTWALYGAATWSRKASAELLAHGARRMSVALEFEAAGERWLVTRSFARSGGGSAELACLSDPAVARVDGVRQVDPAIERLLGLSYEVFCSCVLLPQGRFERLLKATKGEKTDTLKSILHLDHLGDAREEAAALAERLAARERELLVARGLFRPDPAADIAAAEEQIAACEPERARLDALADEVAQLLESCRAHAEAARLTEEAAARLARRAGAPPGVAAALAAGSPPTHVGPADGGPPIHGAPPTQTESAAGAPATGMAFARSRSARLRALLAHEAGLERALAAAREAAAVARSERATIEGELATAAADGLDPAALARHDAAVAGARAALARRDDLHRRTEATAAGLATAVAGLACATTEAARTAEALTSHDEMLAAAAEHARAATATRELVLRQARELEAHATAATEAAAAVEGAATALAAAQGEHTAAAEALVAAEERDAAALVRRDEALAHDAIAHVAGTCAPGDPCPVCEQALPPTFTPPSVPDLYAAQAAVAAARAARDTAAAAERTTAAAEQTADHDLTAARRLAERATDAAETAARALHETVEAHDALPHDVERARAADARSHAAFARAAVVRAQAAADAATARDRQLAAARPELDAARVGAAGAETGLRADVDARRRELAERRAELDATIAELAAAVAALPEWCAVAEAGEAALASATKAIAARVRAAEALARRYRAALDSADTAQTVTATAERALQDEVITPTTTLRAELTGLALELADTAAATAAPVAARTAAGRIMATRAVAAHGVAVRDVAAGDAAEGGVAAGDVAAPDRAPGLAATLFDLAPPRGALDEPPPATPLAPLLAYAEDLEARVEARLAELREAAAKARAAASGDEDAGRRLVAEAGFDHSRALEARLAEIRAAETAAGRERAAAQRQLAPAARLDGLLARAEELRSGFEALKDVLADRAFVGFVVARRQTALLAHASQVLEEITGRYAFTEDFRILDNESGLPRSPDTLSGGETFLASLALALGLVEVADRSGGDLRALFLDEGFGTLDAAVLDMALSTLEERARAGRLIGLISHVPTVAERIDTVLEVTSTVEGSAVERLGDAQRAERVLEAAAGAI